MSNPQIEKARRALKVADETLRNPGQTPEQASLNSIALSLIAIGHALTATADRDGE